MWMGLKARFWISKWIKRLRFSFLLQKKKIYDIIIQAIATRREKVIKNVVFDFGRVLVRFDEPFIVSHYVSNPDDIALITKVVFDRLYWAPLDAGTISDEEVVRLSKERLPQRLWEAAEKSYYNWIYHIPLITGMDKVVERVKRVHGRRIFLLSNISEYFAKRDGVVPILSLFEKKIYSGVCKMIKPQREMFEYLCDSCQILPEETLFIDDSPINIAGAESFGIKGYLFDGDVEKLSKYLDKLFLVENFSK